MVRRNSLCGTATVAVIDALQTLDIPYILVGSLASNMNDDPFARERFARRQRSPFLGRQAFVPTPEDVVVMKLRWAWPKDAEDARGVIAVQGDRLDWNYIRRWCDAHGTRELLDKARASTLPFHGDNPLLPSGTS